MNSKALVRAYEYRYKEFFSQNTIVCSVPFSIPRAGGEHNSNWDISIGQKIPLRMYIWVKTTNKSVCELDTVSYQDVFTGTFIQSSLLEYLPYAQEIERFLESRYLKSTIRTGFRLSVLTELPRGVGAGFDWCFVLLIAVVIRRLENKLYSHIVEKNNSIPLFESINNPGCEYYTIIKKIEEIEHAIWWNILSSSVFTAMSDWLYPVVSIRWELSTYALWDKHNLWNTYHSYRLSDLTPVSRIPYIPIDFGLLFSWMPMTSFENGIMNTKQSAYNWRIEDFFKKLFSVYFENEHPFKRPSFYKTLMDRSASDKKYEYINDTVHLEILYAMIKMYSKNFDDATILQYIHAVNKMRYISNLTSKERLKLQNVIDEIYVSFRSKSEYLALSHTARGGGWSIAFVMPFEWLRTMLSEALSELTKKWQWIKLIYASRQDWTESKGIYFDQDFEKDLFSDYIEPNTLCLHSWDWEKIYGNYMNIMSKNSYDILVDTIHMKLYICWEKPSSKELHTQSGAVEVLSYLFEKTDADIENTQLPSSTYSKNKNDMNGKIILPLTKFVNQKTWKDLLLTASGSLHSFSVRLNKSNLTIWLLKKCI